MSSKGRIYLVFVSEDYNSKSELIYTTSKRDKAERFLSNFLKDNPRYSRAYIESQDRRSIDKWRDLLDD